jgi:hypothetical protein
VSSSCLTSESQRCRVTHPFDLFIIGALEKENSILIVYFSDEVLDAVAEIKKLQCRLLEGKGMTAEFKTYGSDLFEQF